MAATAEQVAQLRRMTAEPTDATYSDADLTTLIENYPTPDERGEQPYTWNTATTPPSQVVNPAWITTYDLHMASAQIWEEKAAIIALDYDFSADGGTYSRSQAYQQAKGMVAFHRSRGSIGTITLEMWPPPRRGLRDLWMGNQPEPGDYP